MQLPGDASFPLRLSKSITKFELKLVDKGSSAGNWKVTLGIDKSKALEHKGTLAQISCLLDAATANRLRTLTIPAIPATVSGFGGIAPCAISRPRAACLWQRPRRMVAVVVKWGKNTYEVELDTSESVETFKAQLFALTSVPIERQKIMGVKGGTLKDDAKFDTLGIKPGQKLMMMGSADVLAAPPSATVFAEDLPQVTRALTVAPASTSPLTLTLTLTCTLTLAYRRRRSTRRRRRTRLGWPTWATRATSTRRCSAGAPSPR